MSSCFVWDRLSLYSSIALFVCHRIGLFVECLGGHTVNVVNGPNCSRNAVSMRSDWCFEMVQTDWSSILYRGAKALRNPMGIVQGISILALCTISISIAVIGRINGPTVPSVRAPFHRKHCSLSPRRFRIDRQGRKAVMWSNIKWVRMHSPRRWWWWWQ